MIYLKFWKSLNWSSLSIAYRLKSIDGSLTKNRQVWPKLRNWQMKLRFCISRSLLMLLSCVRMRKNGRILGLVVIRVVGQRRRGHREIFEKRDNFSFTGLSTNRFAHIAVNLVTGLHRVFSYILN